MYCRFYDFENACIYLLMLFSRKSILSCMIKNNNDVNLQIRTVNVNHMLCIIMPHNFTHVNLFNNHKITKITY